ncbi:Hypothetical_protein [Hexamita inflata]|uniref:Hypothetical_protein n=1 Tax=Hexamita inflata TaxID=28002 RepID=A0AA86PKI4_9EUKA|nr:Hypothetical protein HINF_LOCUS29255 [Hexamita inflata]
MIQKRFKLNISVDNQQQSVSVFQSQECVSFNVSNTLFYYLCPLPQDLDFTQSFEIQNNQLVQNNQSFSLQQAVGSHSHPLINLLHFKQVSFVDSSSEQFIKIVLSRENAFLLRKMEFQLKVADFVVEEVFLAVPDMKNGGKYFQNAVEIVKEGVFVPE